MEFDKERIEFLIIQEGTEFVSHQYNPYWTYFRLVKRSQNFGASRATLKAVVYALDIWEEEILDNPLSMFFSSISTSATSWILDLKKKNSQKGEEIRKLPLI